MDIQSAIKEKLREDHKLPLGVEIVLMVKNNLEVYEGVPLDKYYFTVEYAEE
jgi:hypothetical protein